MKKLAIIILAIAFGFTIPSTEFKPEGKNGSGAVQCPYLRSHDNQQNEAVCPYSGRTAPAGEESCPYLKQHGSIRGNQTIMNRTDVKIS